MARTTPPISSFDSGQYPAQNTVASATTDATTLVPAIASFKGVVDHLVVAAGATTMSFTIEDTGETLVNKISLGVREIFVLPNDMKILASTANLAITLTPATSVAFSIFVQYHYHQTGEGFHEYS